MVTENDQDELNNTISEGVPSKIKDKDEKL